MKPTRIALFVSILFATGAHAGGITLPEIATFDSVSSVGVANATNRTDASAMATSPAGLSAVQDYSFSIGASYLDAASAHRGHLYNPSTGDYDIHTTTRGKKRTVLPSAAYAQRINDQVVLGASLHGEGGLGMEYSNGTMGGGLYKEQSVEIMNLHLGGAYQVADNFSIGGALIVQNLSAELNVPSLFDNDDDSTQTSFMLSAMYDFSPSTYIAINYKHSANHKLSLDSALGPIEKNFKWPSILTIGLSHQFDENWGMKLQTGFEEWKEYGKADGRDMKNVYHFGAAVNYMEGNFKYQAGARWDSKAMNDYDAQPDLPLVEQYAMGAGVEYTRANGHRVGLAYEYRNLGTPTVSYNLGTSESIYYKGEMTSHRLHFLTLSYAY